MVLQLLGVRFPADRRLLYQKLIVMIILKKWEELVFRSLIIIKEKAIDRTVFKVGKQF